MKVKVTDSELNNYFNQVLNEMDMCSCEESVMLSEALTASDKSDIKSMIKKEIKDFLNSSTTKQFEDKLVDRISKEMKKGGKLDGQLKDLIIKSFREFYTIMYQQRSFWESKFKGM